MLIMKDASAPQSAPQSVPHASPETGQDRSRPRLKQKIRTTNLDSRKVESDQDGLMSYGTCHMLPPVFLLSSRFFPDPPDPL